MTYTPNGSISIDGSEVLRRRQAIPMSQAELAHKARLNVNTIKLIESGGKSVYPKTARSLAKAFKCDVSDLVETTEVAS